MRDYTFSVITPVFNRQDCIGRCIESVFSQDYLKKEHIIINDGSSDRTKQVILSYKDSCSFVQFKDLPQNRGVNYAWNRGLEIAKGDFVILLGSDDFLAEHALRKINRTMNERPEFSYYLFVPSDREAELKRSPKLTGSSCVITYEDWVTERIDGDFVHVIKRCFFNNKSFFEDIKGMEGLNLLRIYRDVKRQWLSNEVVVIRERNRKDSHSRKAALNCVEAMEAVYNYYKRFIPLYFEDYRALNPVRMRSILKKTILLSIALSRYSENKTYFQRLELLGSPKYQYLFLRMLHEIQARYLVFQTIRLVSKANRFRDYIHLNIFAQG